MRTSYKVVTVSSYVPVSLDVMKMYLKMKVSDTSRDDLLRDLLEQAQDYVQRYTKRYMGEYKIEQVWDDWPEDGVLTLLAGVLRSVDVLHYWDGTDWVLVDASDYYVDTIGLPTRVKLLKTPPSPTDALSGVRMTYFVGQNDGSDIPLTLLTQIKMLVAQWLEKGADQDTTDLGYVNKILKQYVLHRP